MPSDADFLRMLYDGDVSQLSSNMDFMQWLARMRHQNRTVSPPPPSDRWYVLTRYKIVNGVVVADIPPQDEWPEGVHTLGPFRICAPTNHPELPEKLAQLQNEDDILDFVNTYDLLGYDRLVPEEHKDGRGETVSWILAHAATVKLCLELTGMIQKVDLRGIVERLAIKNGVMGSISYAILDQVIDKPDPKISEIGNRPSPSFWVHGAGPLELARHVRRELINGNRRRVYHFLHSVGDRDVDVIGFGSLIEAIYHHLADTVTQGRGVRPCKECGTYFVHSRRGQKFCPPPLGWKDSKCAVRHRVRDNRAKARQTQGAHGGATKSREDRAE